MILPWLLQVALDQGLGAFFHDQAKITFPPRGKIQLDYAPPTVGVVWVTFAMTFGDMPEDSLEIWHYSGDGRMRRHWDPAWYSLGIGASFEYPLWIYVTSAEPHVLEMENLTDGFVTADVCIWMVEMTRSNFEKFRRFIKGIYNFFSLFGSIDIEELEALKALYEGRLVAEVYPELREQVKSRLTQSRDIVAEKLRIRAW